MTAHHVWIDKDGWTRRIDADGKAWRWDGIGKVWVRTPERDTK